MRLTYKEYLSIAVLLCVVGVFSILWQRPWQTYGSVVVGNEYTATSTDTQAKFANYSVLQSPTAKAQMSPAGSRVATSAPTVLGTIIITKPGTSPMCFYDATSTRTNAENATSTMWIACWPGTAQNSATSTVGTYGPYDISLKHGILVEFFGSPTADTRASTTITFR